MSRNQRLTKQGCLVKFKHQQGTLSNKQLFLAVYSISIQTDLENFFNSFNIGKVYIRKSYYNVFVLEVLSYIC